MKRLLVVLLLYLFSQRTATGWNFAGLLACTVGLLIYARDKSRSREDVDKGIKNNKHTFRWRILIVATLGLIVLVAFLSRTHLNHLPSIWKPTPVYILQPNHSYHYKLNTFETRLNKPHHSELLPELGNLPKSMSRDILRFLKTPLHEHPEHVNFISEKLQTSREIIKETQRLHFSIIGRELEGFKYAFLFDIAAFENKGDPAITVGEVYFLSRMNIEIKYYCSASRCTEEKLKKARDMAKDYSPKDLVILVHGGGNIIGYALNDVVRFHIIELFPSFKKLVFPQSIWIRQIRHPHVNRTAAHYCCVPNLTLVLRDALSYSIAKQLYNGTTRLIMAPDMAFQIGRVPRFMSPVFDVMWVKRKDAETPNYQPPTEVPKNLKVHVSDWWKWPTPAAKTTMEKAFYIATNGFFYLQRGRVVITDRLHGHILSTLLDIPHVIIDNKAKKLSAYHNTWTRSLNNVVLTDDPRKALDLAIGLLKKYNDTLPAAVPFPNIQEDFQKTVFGILDTTYA